MEHYFTNNPDLKSEIRKITFKYNESNFLFYSDNGVFSKNKIDYASNFLLDCFLKTNKEYKNKYILDIGCGYGLLGIVISKIMDSKVDMVDINKRAIHLTNLNIKENKVNANAFASDGYNEVKNKYDYIITNPPIRAGKEILYNILKGAKNHLKENGELWFVINKNQGAKSTKKELELCYNVEEVAKSKGFYVLKAKIY